MRTRLYNCKILTMEEPLNVFDGEIWVKDSQIEKVIKYSKQNTKAQINKENSEIKFDIEKNLKNKLLLPGFKNCHTHSAMTFLRSFADDLPLEEWLYDKVFPLEKKITPDLIYYFTKLAILEYLSSGITCDFDMYFLMKDGIQARIDSGFRGVFTLPVTCNDAPELDIIVKKMWSDYEYANTIHPLISCYAGFHSVYTTNEDLLKEVAKLSHEKKSAVFTHNSETKTEVSNCLKAHGMTPTQYINTFGLLEYGGGAAHAVYLNDDDIKILKDKNIFVITNPCSNAKLASGIAPLLYYHNKGLNICIGTDGAASNNSLDFFKEMYLAAVLQKLLNEDAKALVAEEVLRMATVNGALCAGLKNCTNLSEGKKADIVCLDLFKPNMQPEHSIIKNIVYSGSKENVYFTMIDGKILYENGKYYIGEKKEYIYKQCNKILKKIKK